MLITAECAACFPGDLASSIFVPGFGSNTSGTATIQSSLPSAPVNIFTPPQSGSQMSSSSFLKSQAPIPPFGSGFHKSTTSTDLVSSAAASGTASLFKFGDSLKQPSSASLTFSGFSGLSSSNTWTEVSSSDIFGEASGSAKSLTFGKAGQPHEGKSIDSASVSKPLFPTMSQPRSVLNTSQTSKPQSGAVGIFGHAFATATGGIQAKENKEAVIEEKIKGSATANLTALVIKDIPEMYNKNAWLRRFYSRFGEVTKVVCNAAKKSATITFKTHVSEGL